MLKKISLVTATAASLLSATPVFAAHPLITDDSGTQGKGKVQIELNSEFAWNRTDDNGVKMKEDTGETALALSFGIAENIDLVVGIPFAWYTIRENGLRIADDNGIGDMSLEIKFRVYENEESGLSLAVKPGISIPTGDEQQGFGSGEFSPGITLIATHEGDFGALHANVGYSRNNYKNDDDDAVSSDDIWHASIAAELNMTDRLRTVANIGVETGEEITSDTHPVFLVGGLIYSVSENLDLDIGLKCGLNDAETDSALLAGLAARF
ncbi:MAG: transporter [Chlorobium sp.]|uniref:transporter n=1 Tax=Chlorobium sp. TaxID=1095 RepID=UPI0025C04A3C|nr:transporter [Chlorobium sp.]MCF8383029.1 transporter [Chlorobium sp.]